MIERYLKICELLEQLGSNQSHLDQVQSIIQKSDFRYDPLSRPDFLVNLFLASSYWLDTELFDESCLYKTDHKNTSAHLKMLDIGCTLIDKGFSLKYYLQHYNHTASNQLGGYIKTFANQCYKRHAFLQKRISHQKKNGKNLIFQKTLV